MSQAKTIDSPITIIGAAGFLGTHAARHLGAIAKDVRCFSRLPADHKASGCTWIKGAISDQAALMEAMGGCETIVHVAGASTPLSASKDRTADAEDSIMNSLRLFDACVAAKVKRVIFISSGGTVYGIPDIVPTPEHTPTHPISAYGVAKLAVEHYLEVYRRQHGLDYRILRASNVYGPLQNTAKKQGVVAAFIERALQGQPLEIWGDGKNIRDYIYVDDVMEAIERAILHQGEHRIFNIGSGEGLSLLQIIEMLNQALGRELPCTHHAAGQHNVPASILDCSLARAELGWHARTSFADGLQKTVEWMRQAYLKENRA